MFLGLILGGGATSTFPLAVVDSDRSSESREFVESLEASTLLKIRDVEADKVEKAVKDQKVAAALVIPAGFGTALQTEGNGAAELTLIRIDASSGAQSAFQAVDAVVSRLNAQRLAAQTAARLIAQETQASSESDLVAQAAALSESQLSTPVVEVNVVDADPLDTTVIAQGFDQSSTGGIVNWVLFGIMGVAGITVWERKQGLLRRLNVAGVHARQIVGGKMLAMIAVTLLQQLLLVLVGRFALGVDYFASPLALFLVMLSLSGLAASVGLLISVLFRSEQAVVATTVISALMLAAMGGAWFPLEVTAAGFSRLAHILPSAWIMDSLHGITLSGWGVADVLLPLGIVWAWIVVVFGVALWRYRPE